MCDIPARQTYTTNERKLKTIMNYYQVNEKIDLQKLMDFNQHKNLFDTITPTQEGHHVDATATHVNRFGEKREFNIELKTRHCSVKTYPSIFIEDYKLADMLLDYQMYGTEPLYICFYKDAIAIFNLSKLTVRPQAVIKNIYSGGKDKQQMQERRYCLSLNDAVVYNNNFDMIKRLGESGSRIHWVC